MISWKVIFGKINKLLVFIFIILFCLLSATSAKDNKILLKVNNEIITSVDILNEIEYLSIINDKFKNTEKNIQIEIEKNSLIKEKIKIIELSKYKKALEININLMENIIIKSFSSLNINSISDFEFFFKKQKIKTNYIKKKITIETLWNQLIYSKFYKNVKIDEDQIKKSISNKKIQKEYLLSEIVINSDNSKDFKKKLQMVQNTIKEKEFSEAALIHSSSESSKKGGKLGWIKESVLNNKIKNELYSKIVGDVTNPIIIPGGLLILKIEDIKETENKINLEKEIEIIIKNKTNSQLNRLSTVYLNKIKKNISINEI